MHHSYVIRRAVPADGPAALALALAAVKGVGPSLAERIWAGLRAGFAGPRRIPKGNQTG